MAAKKAARKIAQKRPVTTVSVQRATQEAIKRRKAQIESLASAPRLLKPDEVAGDYDAGRALQTTLGGELRDITADDLAAFRKNVATIGKKFKGGVTAKVIISRALPIDLKRANKEIRQAVPARARQGKITFVTNAGPESKDMRHFVTVEMMAHPAAVGASASAKYLSKKVAEGPLKVSCDCGRWIFWYSYIATIGGFSSGPPQSIYPKIRNPKLAGVACKHVLRVAQQLTTAPVVRVLEKMIETDRAAVLTGRTKSIALSAQKAAEFAAKQAREAGMKRNLIVSSGVRRAEAGLKAQIRATVAKRANAVKPEAAQRLVSRLTDIASVNGLSQSDYEAIMKIVNKRNK